MGHRVHRFWRWWPLAVALALATAAASAAPARAAEEEWSREALAYVARSLAEVADRIAKRPPADDLAKLGFGAAHDAREMTGKSRTVRPNVGYLRPLDTTFRLVAARDPAIEIAARTGLEARLGGTVTDAEVDAEIAQSDARIARLNAALAERHAVLQATQERGRIPAAQLSPLLRSHFRPAAALADASRAGSGLERDGRDATDSKLAEAARLASLWPIVRLWVERAVSDVPLAREEKP